MKKEARQSRRAERIGADTINSTSNGDNGSRKRRQEGMVVKANSHLIEESPLEEINEAAI